MDKTALIKKLLGGGSAAGSVIFVYLYFDSRTEALDKKIDLNAVSIHRTIEEKDRVSRESLSEIKQILEKIDSRMFNMQRELRSK